MTSTAALTNAIFAQLGNPIACEIKLWPLSQTPAGWALCHGQVLNIADHPVAGALLGDSFGGDGSTTFGVPNLRGRVALGADDTHALASSGGQNSTVLANDHLPASQISNSPGSVSPGAGLNYLASTTGGPPAAGIYTSTAPSSGCFISGSATQTAVNTTPAHVALNHIIYLG